MKFQTVGLRPLGTGMTRVHVCGKCGGETIVFLVTMYIPKATSLKGLAPSAFVRYRLDPIARGRFT
jgi:hypothetical protein